MTCVSGDSLRSTVDVAEGASLITFTRTTTRSATGSADAS
jgi:hypothetical protein